MEKDVIGSCGRCMMDEFDDNTVAEILLHLPLKLKFQCKAVCKRWLLLISTPYFARRVLAKQQEKPWYLLYQSNSRYDTNVHRKLRVAYEYNPEFTIQTFQTFQFDYEEDIWPRVYAVHSGLLMCRHHNKTYVCNPLTRKWVSLPRPRILYRSPIGFIVSCDNGSTQFKVVRLFRHGKKGRISFAVFSSEVGQWIDTGVAWPEIDLWGSIGVVHDGKLHWRVRTHTSSSLIVYDLDKNECQVLSFNVPMSVRFEGGLIGTCCGRLCFANCVCEPNDVLSVCVLENYETGEWRPLLITQLRTVLDANEIKDDFFDMFPRAFHPFDMDTVYFETSGGRLLSLNLRTQKLSGVIGEAVRDQCTEWFPYVVPAWPTSVPQQTWETENCMRTENFSSCLDDEDFRLDLFD